VEGSGVGEEGKSGGGAAGLCGGVSCGGRIGGGPAVNERTKFGASIEVGGATYRSCDKSNFR